MVSFLMQKILETLRILFVFHSTVFLVLGSCAREEESPACRWYSGKCRVLGARGPSISHELRDLGQVTSVALYKM